MKILDYKILLLLLLFACEPAPKQIAKIEENMNEKLLAYIGTYTRTEGHVNGKAEGIYRVSIDTVNGEIGNQRMLATITNPSFLKISKDGKQLYAVSELAREDEPTGYLHQYEIQKDTLVLLSRLPTDGKAPCHISLDQSGQYVFVTNYVGGLLKVYQRQADGKLAAVQSIQLEGSGVHPEQQGSHLHASKISPDNKWLAVADKGSDQIWLFLLDLEKEALFSAEQVSVKMQAGAGPRHLDWSADGQFLYVINELDNSVNVIQYNAENQEFVSIQSISTLPKDYEADSFCADLHLHPNGRFLYASNRGHNSITIYRIAPETGRLSWIGYEKTRGEFPRNFNLSPNGNLLFVANQNTDNITSYRIDKNGGTLKYLDLNYTIATPVCIAY
ncbi:MAG: lactonase family protein [Bacteroidota bacterium]